ncbi:ammonium transporter family protein [Fundicoccus culcitae]|uniref:Ammonium transporter n=1 Tax=Fundicoccus culcitae TaxID=2969821 RepID=A0ABY5P3I9_9LACT|nr:ammonium transporter [Fundicoccus culcitae]UUX33293.1 ammonium transporter [Fundicoccus culcitae]
MAEGFILFCVVIMWPMLFSVPVLYGRYAAKVGDTLLMTTVALFVAFLAWVILGYYLTFAPSVSVEGYGQYLTQLQAGDSRLILAVVLQACFFLYAVGMFVGTLMHRVEWPFFILFVPLWLLLVYVPIARLLWNPQGFLHQAGALDFSGGLVVHVSAGFTSLLLACYYNDKESEIRIQRSGAQTLSIHYLATILISFGWFGFNLGPIDNLDKQLGLVLINTILAIIGGSAGFLLYRRRTVTIDDLMSGMIVGLVTSTALVGYVRPLEMLVVTVVSGLVVCFLMERLQLNDPVDSFVMNGVGGLVGALGSILLVNPALTPDGQAGVFISGVGLKGFPLYQGIAIVLTILISLIGTYLALIVTDDYLRERRSE